jgi:hypothetical protein
MKAAAEFVGSIEIEKKKKKKKKKHRGEGGRAGGREHCDSS